MVKRRRGRPMICDSIGAEITNENELYKDKTAKYLAELRFRLRHKAAGYCSYGACKEKAKSYCEFHQAYVNRRAREKRKKGNGKNNGL